MVSNETTIPLKRTTRDALKKRGRKDETYDQLILRILQESSEGSIR